MAKIGTVQEIINYIIEKDGDLKNEWMAAEHDVIYLPIPKNCTEEEAEQLAEKWEVSVEDDSFKIFV